jgi:hypothetical protein
MESSDLLVQTREFGLVSLRIKGMEDGMSFAVESGARDMAEKGVLGDRTVRAEKDDGSAGQGREGT